MQSIQNGRNALFYDKAQHTNESLRNTMNLDGLSFAYYHPSLNKILTKNFNYFKKFIF